MSESPISVCNLALAAIGARASIASFSEGTIEADTCAIWYDSTRRLVGRAANWQCNKAYVNAAVLKAAPGTPENPSAQPSSVWNSAYPPPPWLYSYSYPDDCIRLRTIQGSAVQGGGFAVPLFSSPTAIIYPSLNSFAPFNEATDLTAQSQRIKVIVTNQSQAVLCYSTDVEDPNVWDSGFLDAMIHGLAGRITMGITGKEKTMSVMYQMANRKLLEAQAMDANEQTVINDVTPDWIAVRQAGWQGSGVANNGWVYGPYGPLFGGSLGS
jgi:hypothetical protein